MIDTPVSLRLCVSWLVCGVAILSAQARPPDLILHNARIYTVDSRNSVAAAVAIAGDRII